MKQLIASDLVARNQELEMISSCTLDQCQILVMKHDTYHALKAAVQSKLQWCDGVISGCDAYFGRFTETDLVQFITRFDAIRENAIVFLFDTIEPIFVAANHMELFAKSRDLSMEMTTSVLNIGQTIQRVYEVLVQYKENVVERLPKANAGNHFLYKFKLWCDGLVAGFDTFDLSVAQCQIIANELNYGGSAATVNALGVTTYGHNCWSAIHDISMQQQMLSYDFSEIEGLKGPFDLAWHQIIAGEDVRTINHLNYTVLWELHKKYELILGGDLSKLRYEMALNSFLFLKHAKLFNEVVNKEVGNEGVKEFNCGLMGLEKCTTIFGWMCEVKFKFSEELIPWSIQAIFTGDEQAIDMITQISQWYPNGELKELERQLRNALEKKGDIDEKNRMAANEIKYKLTELYKSYENKNHVGAKLFKRFYEMFDWLEQAFAELMERMMTDGGTIIGGNWIQVRINYLQIVVVFK